MSVAVPPAPPPPIYSRGEHHGRIGRHRVLVIFVGVLVVGVVIATLLVKGNAPPAPQPVCPTLPCGKPPTPPTSTAAAFVPGTPFTSSKYGYRFDFDPRFWKITSRDASEVELAISGSVILTLQGHAPSEGTPEELMSARADDLPLNLVSLTQDATTADRVLGPAVGYRRGVGEVLTGALDTAQGPGAPVDVLVMAATDGRVTVVMTLVCLHSVKADAFALTDTLMNDFRFPSEVPG